MRKLAWWFCMFGMTLRRALYRPVFLLFLLIFPLGMGVLHQVEKRDSGRIAVALCPGTDAWNQALAERLESEESRSFFFYPCGTEEEAKKAVMTGRAECAYLFPERLKERLDDIELDLLAIFGYDLFQYLLVFRGYFLCQDMYRNLLFRVIHTNRGY